MLAARIHFGQRLVDKSSTPSFYLTESGGRVTLHISIALNNTALMLADDEDGTQDPDIIANYRDARIGGPLLPLANLSVIETSMIDPLEGASTFTLEGTILTKIPGTGLGFAALKFKQKHDH
jgi:hypothetical protein